MPVSSLDKGYDRSTNELQEGDPYAVGLVEHCISRVSETIPWQAALDNKLIHILSTL